MKKWIIRTSERPYLSAAERRRASAGQIKDRGYVLQEEEPPIILSPLEHVVMATEALVMCQSSRLPWTHVIEVKETASTLWFKHAGGKVWSNGVCWDRLQCSDSYFIRFWFQVYPYIIQIYNIINSLIILKIIFHIYTHHNSLLAQWRAWTRGNE